MWIAIGLGIVGLSAFALMSQLQLQGSASDLGWMSRQWLAENRLGLLSQEVR